MDAFRRLADRFFQTLNTSEFLGNTWRAYVVCALILIIGYGVIRVVHRRVLGRLQKWAAATSGKWDDVLVSLVRHNLVPILYVVVVYHALKGLRMHYALNRALEIGITVALAWQGVQIAMTFINEGLKRYWHRNSEDQNAEREKSVKGIITLIKAVIWIMAAILAMDNLGIKVSAFMAGLGITGIAVALAAQAVLGDLFAYFVIFFDKPFEVGDFIKVGQVLGNIEHIGLKTTRLRSLTGEQIILSNKYLTDMQVHNFKRMERRRIAFTFELEYATSPEILRALPEKIKAIVLEAGDTTFDRSHFQAISDSGLRFETVYFVEVADYNRYMDIQQQINLRLKAEVEALGAAFAYPTRTLHMPGPPPARNF